MIARVYINGATIMETPIIIQHVIGKRYFALSRIELDSRCILLIKIFGTLDELAELLDHVCIGDRINANGRLHGIRQHRFTCWARDVRIQHTSTH